MKDTKSNQRKSVIMQKVLQTERRSDLKFLTHGPFSSEGKGDDVSQHISVEVATPSWRGLTC